MARAQTRTQYYPLGGGLDLATPALSVPPGRLLACVNFEPHYSDGYRRINGYERFDGRPRPHLQAFTGFQVSNVTSLSVGDTVTGGTSGATGEVVGIYNAATPNWIGVTKVAGGPFQNGETITSGAFSATIDSAPTARDAPTVALELDWLLVARNSYRDDIGVVPGSGNVLGAWRRLGDTYAIRDNVGGTAGVLHRATTSGWTTSGITLAHTLKYDAGGGGAARALPVVGDTVTGGTSGATGTVHRVFEWAGSTASNDATGYLVLTSVSGTFQDNEDLEVSTTARATANGANTQISFSPDGDYRFVNNNFFGGASTFRTYGVNGVDDAFEIDENRVVSQILIPTVADLTGASGVGTPPAAADKPYLVEVHRGRLYLAFPGGRFVNSVAGEPGNFSGFLNAGEFGVGDEITGMKSLVGGVLSVTTERQTFGLFGSDSSDWELRLLAERQGARKHSIERLDTVYALDDLGVTSLARTDQFGDFMGSTVSELVQTLVNAQRTRFTDSTVNRETNQYRIYFSDNSFLIMYVPNPDAASSMRGTATRTKVQFGLGSYDTVVSRIYNTEDENGAERTFFCSDDGYVYEDNVGASFDGAPISAYVRTAFHHMGSPSYRKRFRRVDLEISADSTIDLRVGSDLTYGSSEVSSTLTSLTTTDVPEIDVFGGGGFWDDSNWDEFIWDGQSISTARANLRGTGENIGFLIFNESAVAEPFILQGLTVHYDPRRLQR